MPGKEMKASAAEKRILMLMGVLIISMLALVVVIRMLANLESSREGQANVMANMIAISVNTLSTMDAGQMQKDFTLTKGSRPMTVEVYEKEGVMYVKVTYDDKGNFFEVPLLVKIDPVSPVSLNKISVTKGLDGKISLKGEIGGGWEGIATDVPCAPLPKEKIAEYVNNAVSNPEVNKYRNVDASLVNAVISVESTGMQCINGHLNVNTKSGATGLMQLLPSTAEYINNNFGFRPPLDYKISEDNVKLGTAYLSSLLNQFGGDRNKAIASYNCGPVRIECLAKKYGDGWQSHLNEPCDWPTGCGSETVKYIANANTCMTACDQRTCAIC